MTNLEIIEKAVREVINYQEKHFRTSATWDEAYRNVEDWYNHTDIRSPYLLSACVLAYGKYKPVTASEIMDASRAFEN